MSTFITVYQTFYTSKKCLDETDKDYHVGRVELKVVTKDVHYAEHQCVFAKSQDQCFTAAMMKKSCPLSLTEVNGKLLNYTIMFEIHIN